MRIANVFLCGMIAAILFLAGAPDAIAATTGKLKGKVTYKHTKESLPGVNVQIEGTSIGAVADGDGDYLLMNLNPGLYNVTARMIGKYPVIAKKVEIKGGYTSTQNFELEDSILIFAPTIVTEYRNPVDLENVANRQVLDGSGIARLPINDAASAVATTTGAVTRGDGLHLWGGRTNEVGMVVDQIAVNDPFAGRGSNGLSMNISARDILEMQITKGGAPAEQGGAISGFVEITTKPPSDSTSGRVGYYTDDFGTGILNKNSFNLDRLEFNLSGPVPLLTSRLLPALGKTWLRGLSYSLSGAADKSDGYANYKQYFNRATNRGFKERSVLGLFNLTDRMKNSYEAGLKLNWYAGKSIKLGLNYRGSWDNFTQFQWDYRYTPATAPVIRQQATVYSFRLTHQLSTKTYYEIILSHFSRDYLEMPGDPAHPGEGLDPGQFLPVEDYETYYDRNGNGQYDTAEPFVNVNGDTLTYGGRPYYSFGDSYVQQPGAPVLRPPTNDPEWRGVDSRYHRQGNSSALVDTILTDWNDNGLVDFYESEPFVDRDGDGHWDEGDYLLRDTNGNGRYDPERGPVMNIDQPEPYRDGDVNLGEPFVDVNLNGVFDQGIDVFICSPNPATNMDLNHNSKYDSSFDPWSPGMPFKDLNGNGLYDPANGSYDIGEPFVDVNGNGKWDARDGFYDRGHQQWAYYQDRSADRTTLDFKINRMFGEESSDQHDVRSGLLMDFHKLRMADLRYPNYPYDGTPDGGPWPDRGIFRDFYTRRPVSGAAFVQDKMEVGTMIASIGLRYDFFIQSADVKKQISQNQSSAKSIAGSQNRFSPRLGFSYPISTVAKVYFNYGHYSQLPEMNLMYRRATQSSSAFGIIGNENLDFEKTIQYAFGVTYKLNNDYVLDASGYYKDIYGIVNSIREGSGPSALNVYQNSDYARARGIELRLDKKYGNFVSGYASYGYAFAYGKSSSENSNYLDDFYSRAIPIHETPLDWDVRHQLTVNLDLAVPEAIHPKLFGQTLPDDWGLNVLWQFNSGSPFTPDKDFPGLRLVTGETPQTNSMRYPATSTVDLRFYKTLKFMSMRYSVDLWINNLMNSKNVQQIFGTTGRYNTNTNVAGANYVFAGTDLARNPLNLGPGRNIRVGLSMEF